MLDGLDTVLDGIISDVQIEMFADAVDAMELFKFYDTVSQISLYISGAGQQEPDMIQPMVFEIVNQGLSDLLGGFEILTVDAPMDCKTAILRGIFYMENTDQSEFVSLTIENAETVKEAFMELLEHFTGKPADYYFPYLAEGDNAFVHKLYEIHKVRSDLAVENIAPVNASAVDRSKRFMEKYPHTLLKDAVQVERYNPGVSADILFNFYQPQLSALYPHALEQLSVEIIGLMCLSNVMTKNFSVEVKKRLSAIIPEQASAAKMVMYIDDITMELKLYATQ